MGRTVTTELVPDENQNDLMDETMEPKEHEMNMVVSPKQDLGSTKKEDIFVESTRGDLDKQNVGASNEVVIGDLNMEVALTTDDVTRAGGFGTRDAINSLLPAATDSTDFEGSLLDVRDYEQPQGEKSRPGLGWMEPKKAE